MITNKQNVLFLGEAESSIYTFLKDAGEQVIQTTDKIDADYIINNKIEFLVSYGYRHIIKKSVLDLLPGAAVNLHISLLPWNRGADPNLWSFIDGTPKGVTIHYIDVGLDTGDIIVQDRIEFNEDKETLASSYAILQERIQHLFRVHWDSIRNQRCPRKVQCGQGTVHKAKDKEPIMALLPLVWDTPVSVLRALGKDFRA